MLDESALARLEAIPREERLIRQTIIHNLCAAFRVTDAEVQEQLIADTTETPISFLEKACVWFRVEYPEPHVPRAGQINQRARVIAGVNGNLPASIAWREIREPAGPAIGPGQAEKRLGATSKANQAVHVGLREQFARARKLREEGVKVPKTPFETRAISLIYVAIEDGTPWPLEKEYGYHLDAIMQEHRSNGGDTDWWWAERDKPTVTRSLEE